MKMQKPKQLYLFRTNQGDYLSISAPEVDVKQICTITFRGLKGLKVREVIDIDVGAFKISDTPGTHYYGLHRVLSDSVPPEYIG